MKQRRKQRLERRRGSSAYSINCFHFKLTNFTATSFLIASPAKQTLLHTHSWSLACRDCHNQLEARKLHSFKAENLSFLFFMLKTILLYLLSSQISAGKMYVYSSYNLSVRLNWAASKKKSFQVPNSIQSLILRPPQSQTLPTLRKSHKTSE
jgi:hypothetical protein